MSAKKVNVAKSYTLVWQDFFRGPQPLWLGALIFLVLKISFSMQIPPNDYWWYLQLGQEILQSHSLPKVDIFTYTQAGKPYIYNAWLSSVLFWLLRDPITTKLLHGFLLLSAYLIVWKNCRLQGAGVRLSMLLTLLAAQASTWHWTMRPQLFSFVLFAFTLTILLHWQSGKTRWVWWLPFISLLWVNLHGAFVLMFLLAGTALVGGEGERRPLFYALSLALVTTMMNPLGYVAWQFVLTMLTDNSTQQIGLEWQPPTAKTNWQSRVFFLWLLFFPFVLQRSSRDLSFTHWLWFFGFGWMALNGIRYTVWFLFVFANLNAFLLAPMANKTLDKQTRFGKPGRNMLIFTLLLFSPFLFLPQMRTYWQTKPLSTYTDNTPVKAVHWLKSHPEVLGNVWGDDAMSTYMIYAIPERPVWIDTRSNLFPLPQWQDYLAIANAEYSWEDILMREQIKILLLDIKRQDSLIHAIRQTNRWYSPYQDQHSVIFLLKSPK